MPEKQNKIIFGGTLKFKEKDWNIEVFIDEKDIEGESRDKIFEIFKDAYHTLAYSLANSYLKQK